MKEFSCGDVVPGCTASFRAETDDDLMQQIARHAQQDHGLTELSDDLITAVRERIRTIPRG